MIGVLSSESWTAVIPGLDSSCSISVALRPLGVGNGPADEKVVPDITKDTAIFDSGVLTKIDTYWQKGNETISYLALPFFFFSILENENDLNGPQGAADLHASSVSSEG